MVEMRWVNLLLLADLRTARIVFVGVFQECMGPQ